MPVERARRARGVGGGEGVEPVARLRGAA
ncbi:MAG: hypothetical protein JWN46_3866, partial [Acidimicrobiales bacterium]|nr:hypothetical protein [Acidimicrobiales bacterium]